MTFLKIDELANKRMKERGFGRQISAMVVIKATQNFFNKKFSSFSNKIQPISYKNDTLVIASLSAPIASELKLHEEKIMKYINDSLGHNAVKKIKIIL